ncbi:hypothetical protein RHORCCE3_0700 [Rickettsia hoogstraalii str. RCCE3]|nr:hypothetical protein RHORCCE3_0700 [Rickettsia hoogstraalii str. RCCE3]
MSGHKKDFLKSPSAITAARRGPAVEKVIQAALVVVQHVQKCEAMQVANDPYYQHMPKNNAAAATIYAAKMGGENHDISGCEIS